MIRRLKLTFLLVLAVGGLYLGQDFLIFPGILHSQKFRLRNKPDPLPLSVERFLISTDDDRELVAWKLPAQGNGGGKQIAILFHGAEDTLPGFFRYQKWFREIGFTSYAFDYRGFGGSSGWPSEAGFYSDADAVVKKVLEREQIAAKDLVLMGEGIGAAVAAEAAAVNQPKSLLLVAPDGNIRQQLEGHAIYRYIAPLVWYRLPIAEFVGKLEKTCVTAVYQESGASASAAKAALDAYRGTMNAERLVSSARSKSIDLVRQFQAQLQAGMRTCSPHSSKSLPAAEN